MASTFLWMGSHVYRRLECILLCAKRYRINQKPPNKTCSDPTRPSDTLPKYDIEIWIGIQDALVVFGEGLASSFLCSQAESTPGHTQVPTGRYRDANRWAAESHSAIERK